MEALDSYLQDEKKAARANLTSSKVKKITMNIWILLIKVFLHTTCLWKNNAKM